MAEKKPGALGPPYVSYRTLRNYLEALAVSGAPNRIDRSVLGNLSGLVQSQLLTAMRYLDLINEEGVPTARLTELVGVEGSKRSQVLTGILQNAYPFMFGSFKLSGATPGQVRERIEAQGVSGETVRKSVAFFLAAAKDAGIILPTHLKTRQMARTARRRNSRGSTNGTQKGESATLPVTDQPNGATRTVSLKSGGTLTLSASVDLFTLGAEDREFVFGLIDRLTEYETEEKETA